MAVSNGRIIDRRRSTAARPSARPARSLVLIVGLALASLAGSLVAGMNTRPAAACSCAGAEVSWFVKNTEAGFIGTLEDRAEGRGNGDEWAQVVNRFSVEAWTHGDLDDAVIDVWAPQGGGACGLEIPVGQTAAVFIDRNDGQWTSSLCATLDAGQVRAAATAGVLPGGEASFAVPGVFPGGGMALLDADGSLIGYDDRFDFEWQPQVYRCPEGQRALLIDNDRAMLTDLADLSVITTVDLEGLQQVAGIRSVECADPDGDSMLVLVEGNRGVDIRRLEKIGQPGRTIEVQGLGAVAVAGDYVVTQTFLDPGERLSVLDLDGTTRIVAKLLRDNPDSYRGYVDVQARPGDGATVAVLEVDYGQDQVRSRIWMLDPATGEQLAERVVGGDAWSLRWLGTEQLMVLVGGEFASRTEILDAGTLEIVSAIDRYTAFDPILVDDALIGVEDSRVVRGQLDGAAEVLATLPSRNLGSLLALAAPIDVEPSEIEGITLRAPTGSADDSAGPVGELGDESPDTDGGSGLLIPLAIGAAAVVAVALLGLIAARRRGSTGRLRRSPPDP